MKTHLLFLIMMLCPILAKSQWEKTNGPAGNFRIMAYAFNDNWAFTAVSKNTYGYDPCGMIYRSHNKGDNWEPASTGLPTSPSFMVTSLAVSAPYIFAGSDRGVWRSADNGDHWISVTNSMPDTLVVNVGAANGHIFAFTTVSVYKSDDFGSTWVMCFDGTSGMHAYSTFTSIGSTLFFSDHYAGIYRSQNNGTTWTWIHEPTECFVDIAALGSSLFATDCYGIIRSDDNGSTWSVINDSLLVWKMVAKGSSLYAGGYGSFERSDDNGNTWVSITNGIPVENILSMGADNSSVYVGNQKAVYRTDNDGGIWMKKMNGLPFDRVTSIVTKWTGIYAGTNGGGIFHSTDLGTEWTEMNTTLSCLNVNSLAIKDYELYAGTSEGVFISNTGGEHWVPFNNGLTVKNVNMILPETGKLFTCTEGGGVFVSSDDGVTWNSVNSGLTDLDVRCICKAGPALLCGTHGGGIFRSLNQGTTWAGSNTGMTNGNINSILYHKSRVFAGTDNGIFISDDNGSSWTSSVTGLLSATVHSLISVDHLVLAGTDEGVYRYSESGSKWIQISDMLPDTVVTTLAASKTDLFAGIAGSGVWTRPLSDFSFLSVDPGSLTLAKTANNEGSITVDASGDWSLQGVMPGWLTVDKWNGAGNEVLRFNTLLENPTAQVRSAGFSVVSEEGLSVAFTVVQLQNTMGTANLSHNALRIWPVPSPGIVHVEGDFIIEEIMIAAADGKQVSRQQPGQNRADVDLSMEGKGVYFMKILYSGGVVTRKILIQ